MNGRRSVSLIAAIGAICALAVLYSVGAGALQRGYVVRRTMNSSSLEEDAPLSRCRRLALDTTQEVPWVRPGAEMHSFMKEWRELGKTGTSYAFQRERFLNNTDLVVYAGDPDRDIVPVCNVRRKVLFIGDSHVRDFGETICLMAGHGRRCSDLAPREAPNFFDFEFGQLQVYVRWIAWYLMPFFLELDAIPADMDVVVFGSGAWATTYNHNHNETATLVHITLAMLRRFFPRARLVVLSEWHRHYMPHRPQFDSFKKENRMEGMTRCAYGDDILDNLRMAYVCGAQLFFESNASKVTGNISGVDPRCDDDRGVYILDLLNVTKSIPQEAIADDLGHHYHGPYGEALTLHLMREHLCPLPGRCGVSASCVPSLYGNPCARRPHPNEECRRSSTHKKLMKTELLMRSYRRRMAVVNGTVVKERGVSKDGRRKYSMIPGESSTGRRRVSGVLKDLIARSQPVPPIRRRIQDRGEVSKVLKELKRGGWRGTERKRR